MRATVLKIATWNLNTWINRARKGISNEQLWDWVLEHCSADLYLFTEAATPPPARYAADWWFVHRPGGFPGVSNWGTVIALRKTSGLQLRHLTHVGEANAYRLDTLFPGSLTAADIMDTNETVARVVGLYLPFRKDKAKKFIDSPSSDLTKIRNDLDALATVDAPLVIGGDLNAEYSDVPATFDQLGTTKKRLVDPFVKQYPMTFEQDWADRRKFRLDYLYLDKDLANKIMGKRGGIKEFPEALRMSDHAPLWVEVAIARD